MLFSYFIFVLRCMGKKLFGPVGFSLLQYLECPLGENRRAVILPVRYPVLITHPWSLFTQAGARCHQGGHQHESGRALRQRSLRCDWSSQVAVWRMVTWRHAGQSHGVRRPPWVTATRLCHFKIKSRNVKLNYLIWSSASQRRWVALKMSLLSSRWSHFVPSIVP